MELQVLDYKHDEPAWLELRKQHVTSSEVAALWNASPYTSELEIWMRMRTGESKPIRDNERMKFGRMFESAIGQLVSESIGARCLPFKRYIYSQELRIGSSFDWRVYDSKSDRRGWNIEVKNVDGLVFWGAGNDWHDENNDIVLPVHIELQVHHQMALGGWPGTIVAVFVGGNQLHMIEVERDEEMCERILARVAEFWDLVDRGEMPEIDYHRDARVLIAMNQGSGNRGVDMSDNARLTELAWAHMKASAEAATLRKELEAMKAEMLELIGTDVNKVYLGEGVSIPCGMTKGATDEQRVITTDDIGKPLTIVPSADDVGSEVTARKGKASYRYFRVNQSKAKRKSAPADTNYPTYKEV